MVIENAHLRRNIMRRPVGVHTRDPRTGDNVIFYGETHLKKMPRLEDIPGTKAHFEASKLKMRIERAG